MTGANPDVLSWDINDLPSVVWLDDLARAYVHKRPDGWWVIEVDGHPIAGFRDLESALSVLREMREMGSPA
jgi:hypothetical protein